MQANAPTAPGVQESGDNHKTVTGGRLKSIWFEKSGREMKLDIRRGYVAASFEKGPGFRDCRGERPFFKEQVVEQVARLLRVVQADRFARLIDRRSGQMVL